MIDDNITQYIKNNKIYLNYKDGQHEWMNMEEFANWCALIVGVNEILDCAEQRGINIHKSDMWIKPLPLENYIREKGNQYFNQLQFISGNIS